MIHSSGVTKSVEVETSLGQISLAERTWTEPIDIVLEPAHYWLELQLLPGMVAGQACFADRWSGARFEPIGRAFMLPASEVVHLKSECRHNLSIGCAFLPAAIQRWVDGELQLTDSQLKQGLNITNPTIHNLLFRLSEEVRAPGLASDVLTEMIFAEIIIELARHSLGSVECQETGGLAPWRMRLINERLAEPGARVSLSELARLCNLSSRQLTRAFRLSTGCSIGNHIAQYRINHAKRLLDTEQNVKSIAHALGFRSTSHFYAAFHRATGETPRQYRQRIGRREVAET